jgi:hypothetical protein
MKKILVILAMLIAVIGFNAAPAFAGGHGHDQHVPVNVCHATSSDTNPFVFITVDDDSAKFKGHLMHRTDPNKTWKSDGTFNGVAHSAGDPKADLIGDFTDTAGVFHKYDGVITADSCVNHDTTQETPHDAMAFIGTSPGDCDSAGSNVVDVENASLIGDLDTSIGEHVAHFVADEGHLFSASQTGVSADGTHADIQYTVPGPNPSLCPNPPKHHHHPQVNAPHHHADQNTTAAPTTHKLTTLPNAGLDDSAVSWENVVGGILILVSLALGCAMWKRSA